MKVTNVRLSEKILSQTDKLASEHGLNRSEVIRQALTVYLHLIENVGTMIRPVAFKIKPAQIGYARKGDVSILRIPTGHAIVVGCTSSGAIGPKSLDKVKVDGRILGKFLARVALMDVAATGAFPIMLSATLGVENEPTGKEIIEGIQREASVLGLEPNEVLMANTEENFSTLQTGVGLTVVGLSNEEDLRIAKTLPGDLLIAIGKPMVGNEVIPAEVRGEIVDLRTVLWLSTKTYVHDIVTVGASGIANEAMSIAHTVGRKLELSNSAKIDLDKSAGPATVVLVSLSPEKLKELKSTIQKPIEFIGKIG